MKGSSTYSLTFTGVMMLGHAMVGCGVPPVTAEPDAAAGVDAGTGIASPDIPWLESGSPPISFLPCPDGWAEVTLRPGVTTCDPYPGGEMMCADGEARFPGEAGCVPLGSPCPAGDFATDLPTDRPVIYIRLGSTSGDGTEARPFGSIGDAIGVATEDAVLALARGTYDGAVALSAGLALWGACAAETTLVATVSSDTAGIVTIAGSTGELRNLTIGPSPRRGVLVSGPSASVKLEGVLIDGARTHGVLAASGAHIEARAVMIRNTQPNIAGALGIGLEVARGATADFVRAVITRNHDLGVFAIGSGSMVSMTGVVVSDTRAETRRSTFGRGVNIEEGASAQIRASVVDRNHEVAVFVSGADSTLTINDTVLRDTRSQTSDGNFGRGLVVQDGASATASRVALERNRHVGVYAAGAGVMLSLEDIVIRATDGASGDESAGHGLSCQRGAAVTVRRALIEDNHDLGVFVNGLGTRLEMEDTLVHGTLSQASDASAGRGLNIQGGASVHGTRVVVEENRDVGVYVTGAGTSLTLSDAIVRDTEFQESTDTHGHGLSVEWGASADLARIVVERNREVGVLAINPGSNVIMTDIVIRDTGVRSGDNRFGYGVASIMGAAQMTRFSVSTSNLCGFFISDDGQLDVSDGEVVSNDIGACIQVDGYDLNRLMRDVQYRDNSTTLQATGLPVPDADRVTRIDF